jgi:hypothetical protein
LAQGLLPSPSTRTKRPVRKTKTRPPATMESGMISWKRGSKAVVAWTPSAHYWPHMLAAIVVIALSMTCGCAFQAWATTRSQTQQESATGRTYTAFQHSAVRALRHWKGLMRRIIRVRWCQLIFHIYGTRLQALRSSFRSRLSSFIRPGP